MEKDLGGGGGGGFLKDYKKHGRASVMVVIWAAEEHPLDTEQAKAQGEATRPSGLRDFKRGQPKITFLRGLEDLRAARTAVHVKAKRTERVKSSVGGVTTYLMGRKRIAIDRANTAQDWGAGPGEAAKHRDIANRRNARGGGLDMGGSGVLGRAMWQSIFNTLRGKKNKKLPTRSRARKRCHFGEGGKVRGSGALNSKRDLL